MTITDKVVIKKKPTGISKIGHAERYLLDLVIARSKSRISTSQERIIINTALIEFTSDGNFIYVRNSSGLDIIRIQCTGIIKTVRCWSSPISHMDLNTSGDIRVCTSSRTKQKVLVSPTIIPVAAIEFLSDGNSVYVFAPSGGTVIRIQCSGSVVMDLAPLWSNLFMEMCVAGDVEVCLAADSKETRPSRG